MENIYQLMLFFPAGSLTNTNLIRPQTSRLTTAQKAMERAVTSRYP